MTLGIYLQQHTAYNFTNFISFKTNKSKKISDIWLSNSTHADVEWSVSEEWILEGG